MKDVKEPLVSVVVIAYNSSVTIIETLDSIKNQTYKNIELIISDDCSNDNTVVISQKWIDKNKDCFVRVEIVTSDKNTGISPNANRGVRHSKGTWLKLIAADDVLLPTCVSSNVSFVTNNPQYDIIFSKIIGIGYMPAAEKCIFKDCSKAFENFTDSEFKTILYMKNFLPAATAFYTRQLFEEVGGFEESIPFLEDHPFWIKALDKGFNFGFNNDFTVKYRFSEQSISQNINNNRSLKFQKSGRLSAKFAASYLSKLSLGAWYYSITSTNVFPYGSIMWKLFHYTNIINPFYYYSKKLHKRLIYYLTANNDTI